MRPRRRICVSSEETHMRLLGDAYASPVTHMRDRPNCLVKYYSVVTPMPKPISPIYEPSPLKLCFLTIHQEVQHGG